MSNPYLLDPKKLKSTQQTVQNEKLVTLKDDSINLAPTLGTSFFNGIMFGSTVGQPSYAADQVKPGWGKRLLRTFFWIWVITLFIRFISKLAS